MVRIIFTDPKDGEFVVDKMWTEVKAGPGGKNLSRITLEDGRSLCVWDPALISWHQR